MLFNAVALYLLSENATDAMTLDRINKYIYIYNINNIINNNIINKNIINNYSKKYIIIYNILNS